MSKIKTAIKMRVTPEQNRKVQEICFEKGVEWITSKTLEHSNHQPYLYISSFSKYGWLWYPSQNTTEYYNLNTYKEVSAELFIRTNGTCVESETLTESIPSEEPQPKTLSEYLKENNAYESFVEYCVERFLGSEDIYKKFKENTTFINISNAFNWADTKPDFEYWLDLYNNQPENMIYDMNEIVFT